MATVPEDSFLENVMGGIRTSPGVISFTLHCVSNFSGIGAAAISRIDPTKGILKAH